MSSSFVALDVFTCFVGAPRSIGGERADHGSLLKEAGRTPAGETAKQRCILSLNMNLRPPEGKTGPLGRMGPPEGSMGPPLGRIGPPEGSTGPLPITGPEAKGEPPYPGL